MESGGVVGIHGISNQFNGPTKLANEWRLGLADGLIAAGIRNLDPPLTMAFYGGIFRPIGTMSAGIPPISPDTLQRDSASELLQVLYDSAIRVDPRVPDRDAETMAIKTPKIAQTVLRRLARSRFFAALGGERAVLWLIHQAHAYLYDDGIRAQIRLEVLETLRVARPRVVIGHSLGSVVAYDLLFEQPDLGVDTLITVGSPLGIPAFLQKQPNRERYLWPRVRRWVNVADEGDPVALVKALQPLTKPSSLGAMVIDRQVDNGWQSHSAARYLNTRQVGEAVADAYA